MAQPWFETVAEAQRRAKKRLPTSVYTALLGGQRAGHLRTATTSSAFGELGFAPHVAGLSGERELATTVMGQEISMPVMISPTGVQAVHPDGEVAVARAAAARGTAMGLSLVRQQAHRGGHRGQPADVLPDVLDGRPRRRSQATMERARAAGAKGLIVTTDWSLLATAATGAARRSRRR